MRMRDGFKRRACPCGQVYRVVWVDAKSGRKLLCYPPGSSEAVEKCIKCGRRLQAKSLCRLLSKPRLADFAGTWEDFIHDDAVKAGGCPDD